MSEQRQWDNLGCGLALAGIVICALFVLVLMDSLMTYGELRDLQRRVGQLESEVRR